MGLHLENEVAVVKTPTIIPNNPVGYSSEIWVISYQTALCYARKVYYINHNYPHILESYLSLFHCIIL